MSSNKSEDLSLSERLKLFRSRLGLSQRDLASLFDVSPATVAMWETGTREVPGPAIILFERLETDLGLVQDRPVDSALKDDHLSKRLSIKVLANLGYGSSNVEKSELNPAEIQESIREMLRRHLAKFRVTRQIQVSLIEKAITSVADVKGVPLKLLQLAAFMDLGLSHRSRESLSKIQASLSPMPTKLVNQVFREEFGRPPDEIFAKWESKPFKVASIGQVHKAILKSGELVAVKVQYPNIYNKIVLQSRPAQLLSYLIALVRSDYSEMLTDFMEKLKLECDYRFEAAQQERCRKAFENDPQIVIPRAHEEYSGARVLTSDFIDGIDFKEFCASASQEERNLAGGIIHRFLYHSVMRHGLFQGDPHPGNFLFLGGKVAFIDFGRVFSLPKEAIQSQFDFYKAVHANDSMTGRKIMERTGYVRDWTRFDFDEFWDLLREQMKYEISGEPVKFDQAYVRNLIRLSKSYQYKASLVMGSNFFWPVFVSIQMWNLLAHLEAEYVWRRNVPFYASGSVTGSTY